MIGEKVPGYENPSAIREGRDTQPLPTKESTTLTLIFEFLNTIHKQSASVKYLGRGIRDTLLGAVPETEEEKGGAIPEAILEKIYQELRDINSNLTIGVCHLNDVSKDLGVK